LESPRVGLDIVASARNHTFLPNYRQSFYWLRYKNNKHFHEGKCSYVRKIAIDYSETRLQIFKEKLVKAKVKLPLCLYVKLGMYTYQMYSAHEVQW
jgi:hypothetical protein